MNLKNMTEILSKKADMIYKKVVILLASSGGSGAYAIKIVGPGDENKLFSHFCNSKIRDDIVLVISKTKTCGF